MQRSQLVVACCAAAGFLVTHPVQADTKPSPIECDTLTDYHQQLEDIARKAISKSDLFRDHRATLRALRAQIADDVWWKTSEVVVLAAVTKQTVDTIVQLTAMAVDYDPALKGLAWIPKAYDCVQQIVDGAKTGTASLLKCSTALIIRKELDVAQPNTRKVLVTGLKVLWVQFEGLRGVVKTEQERLEAKATVTEQLAAIDALLENAEQRFAFEERVITELQAEAIRVRSRLGQCPPATAPRRLQGRRPASSPVVPRGAPLRAVVAITTMRVRPSSSASAESIADARTVLEDARATRAKYLVPDSPELAPVVETDGIPMFPNLGASGSTQPLHAVTDSVRELSSALAVARDELDKSIHADLVVQLRRHRVDQIDAGKVNALLDALYPKLSGLQTLELALVTKARIDQLTRDSATLLREAKVATSPDAGLPDRIEALATVIATTCAQFKDEVLKASSAAMAFKDAVAAIRGVGTSPASQLPSLAQTVFVDRGLGGASTESANPRKSVGAVVMRPQTALADIAIHVHQAVEVARAASALAEVLPVPDRVKHALSRATQVGAVASQLMGVAISGNPLSAISALGSLFGGGGDDTTTQLQQLQQQHQQVMAALGDIARKQGEILALERNILDEVHRLRAEVQAMQTQILQKLDDIEARVDTVKKIAVATMSTDLSVCILAVKEVQEYWNAKKRRYFLFDGTDDKFLDGAIATYLGQCAQGIRENVENSDPGLSTIRPLFDATSWDQQGPAMETLQAKFFLASDRLEDILHAAGSFDERVTLVPSRTWDALTAKLSTSTPTKLPLWYRQKSILSPTFLGDVGPQLLALMPLLEIVVRARGNDIRLCHSTDVTSGTCWQRRDALRALEAFSRIVDVALHQQTILAGDALLSAALDRLETSADVVAPLVAFMGASGLARHNMGLLLAFRGMDRTSTGWYELAWRDARPDALEALLHVHPIQKAADGWTWHLEEGAHSVEVLLPTPEEAELRVFQVPTAVTDLMRLKTQLATERASYDLAARYAGDGPALVDALVESGAIARVSAP